MSFYYIANLHNSANGHARSILITRRAYSIVWRIQIFLVMVTHVQSHHNYIMNMQYS